jgi:GNAT superfamily N-acetyltransferase
MKAAGFTTWSEEKTREALPGCLRDGFFVVVHTWSGRLVATAMARHGFFVEVHSVLLTAGPSPAAAAMAGHGPGGNRPGGGELGWVTGEPGLNCPVENHAAGGELGWVAGDPDHRGKGLGGCVCAAATRRLLEAGYSDIFLRTDDFRLAAIKTYLTLGYVPLLFAPDMAARWKEVFRQLGMTFPG